MDEMTYPHCRNSKAQRDEMKKSPDVYDNVNGKKIWWMIFITIEGYLGEFEDLVNSEESERGARQPLGSNSLGKLWLWTGMHHFSIPIAPLRAWHGVGESRIRDRDSRGSKGGLHTGAYRDSPPWRQRAFGQSPVCIPPTSSPPRCDVHSKEKGKRGCKGSVTGLSWRTRGGEMATAATEGTGWQGWGVRHILTQLTGLNDRCENLLVPLDAPCDNISLAPNS